MDSTPWKSAAADVMILMDQNAEGIVEGWSSRVATAMPELFAQMAPDVWATRLTDTFAVFRTELETPETLMLPVFSRRTGSMRLLELGARAVKAHYLREEMDPHEFQSAYFLLQQAMLDALNASALAGQREPFDLIDHFIKQLSIAMSMAVTVLRTADR